MTPWNQLGSDVGLTLVQRCCSTKARARLFFSACVRHWRVRRDHTPESLLVAPQLSGMHIERRLVVWLTKQALRSSTTSSVQIAAGEQCDSYRQGLHQMSSGVLTWIDRRIVRTLYAALHFSFKMSRQMLPCNSGGVIAKPHYVEHDLQHALHVPHLSVHVGVEDARDKPDCRRLVRVVLRTSQTCLYVSGAFVILGAMQCISTAA